MKTRKTTLDRQAKRIIHEGFNELIVGHMNIKFEDTTFNTNLNKVPLFIAVNMYKDKLKCYDSSLYGLCERYKGDGLKAVHVYLYNQKLKKRKRK